MSRSVSVTAAGQCRLAPLIQVILDCSHLYDYTVKLLFKLHSCEWHGPLLVTTHNYRLTESAGSVVVMSQEEVNTKMVKTILILVFLVSA